MANAHRSYRRTIEDVVKLFTQGQSGCGESVKILEIGAYLSVVSLTLSQLEFSVAAVDIPEFMQNERLQELSRCEDVKTLTAI